MYTLQSTPTVVLLPPIGARAEVLLLHTPATATTKTRRMTTTTTTHATGIPRFNSRGMISSSQPSPSCVPLAPAAVFLSLPRSFLPVPRTLSISPTPRSRRRQLINHLPISLRLPRVARSNSHDSNSKIAGVANLSRILSFSRDIFIRAFVHGSKKKNSPRERGKRKIRPSRRKMTRHEDA